MSESEGKNEQDLVLESSGNLVVTAKPGSGKTHTIVEKIALILPTLNDYEGVIAISYTNKASNELKQRCRKRGIDPKQSFWGTIDKFYIGQIIIPFSSHITGNMPEYNVVSNLPLDSDYHKLLNAKYPFDKEQEELLIKALRDGIIPLELTGDIALYLLEHVLGASEYIKARYKYVFIDEYQDCGEIQHKIFIKLVEYGLIGIAVGDINQAIFGFAHRFPKYLLELIKRKDFEHLELTKNYRCHKSISEYSLCLFNASRSIPDEKRVFAINVNGDERDIAKQIEKRIKPIKERYLIECNKKIAILCKTNTIASLLSNSLTIPNKVFHESSLDNDSSDWARLFRDLLTSYFDDSIYAIDFVEQYISSEYNYRTYLKALELCQTVFLSTKDKLIDCKNEMIQLAKLIYPDKKSVSAIANLQQTLSDDKMLNSFAPARDDEINIMTLHKSKGLEFDAVFHMEMYKYIIPKESCSGEDYEQFMNLHYVGITRAKKVCYIMLGTKRFRAKQQDFYKAEPSPFLSLPGLEERRNNVTWK